MSIYGPPPSSIVYGPGCPPPHLSLSGPVGWLWGFGDFGLAEAFEFRVKGIRFFGIRLKV